MKRVVSILLCVIMVLALSATAFAWDTPNGGCIYMKATENANFRSGPGTNYTALGVLNTGDEFRATDDTYSPWYAGYPGEKTNLYAYYGMIKGYAHSSYLGPL